MNWPKDRKRAFRWAAKAFGTPEAERTKRQKLVTNCGICYAIAELTEFCDIYYWAPNFRIGCGIRTPLWWPVQGGRSWTPLCDTQRSLFCYLMAALSDKEFEEI